MKGEDLLLTFHDSSVIVTTKIRGNHKLLKKFTFLSLKIDYGENPDMEKFSL